MIERINGKVLIIISSPFQAICAVEFISVFEIKNSDIFILSHINDKNQNNGCKSIFDMYGLEYKEDFYVSFLDGIKYICSHQQKQYYSNIILGDYFNSHQRLLASHLLLAKGKIYFLDDGASTYRIFDKKVPQSKIQWAVKQLLINTIIYFKCGKVNNLFSIFELPPKSNWSISKNELTFLNYNDLADKNSGVIIVGANVGFYEPIIDNSFLVLLKREIEWIKENYPNDKIYYYPHRRDRDNEGINSYLQQENVEIVDTQFTVEVDIVINKHSPKLVIGYGSTALYVLKLLLKQAKVKSVFIHTKSKSVNDIYKKISEAYQKQGIEIL